MNNYKLLTLLFSIAFLTSCTNSDTTKSQIQNNTTTLNSWKLLYVNGPFEQASYYFEPSVVTWDFNPLSQMITVVNNNSNNNLNAVLETGVYSYEIINNPDPNSCSQLLKINGTDMGCFSIVNDTLHINQDYVDGFGIHLVN